MILGGLDPVAFWSHLPLHVLNAGYIETCRAEMILFVFFFFFLNSLLPTFAGNSSN
jgi:hypothetical protein